MTDLQGREITYLRLSVTDLCDLRCRYCMPECGVLKRTHSQLCTLEELRDFAQAAVKLGVRKIRLTGGEPLVRNGILTLCRMLREISGLQELCLTTNGTRLSELAQPLKDAGVDRLNISLDTLRPERYREITRMGELDTVLHGMEAAQNAGFKQLKLNCVLMRSVNDDEIADFVSLTKEKPWQVRFIELMPLGACADWAKQHALSAQSVLETCPELLPEETSGVAQLYRLPGAKGSVGLITPMSCAFCSRCNRIRITADGMLKPCLHSDAEIPLRGLSGAALEDALRQGIAEKPPQHYLEQDGRAVRRDMFTIGG